MRASFGTDGFSLGIFGTIYRIHCVEGSDPK